MQHIKSGKNYLVYLEKGESVVEVLTNFCKNNNILNGKITGIGAVNNIELGSYDTKSKKYIKKAFREDHELISYNGNIMLLDNEPFIHAHCTIGNHEMEISGGHVFQMNIAVVGEFIIQKIKNNSKRSFNNEIGLAVWDLNNE
jgi:hypothetical protein